MCIFAMGMDWRKSLSPPISDQPLSLQPVLLQQLADKHKMLYGSESLYWLLQGLQFIPSQQSYSLQYGV